MRRDCPFGFAAEREDPSVITVPFRRHGRKAAGLVAEKPGAATRQSTLDRSFPDAPPLGRGFGAEAEVNPRKVRLQRFLQKSCRYLACRGLKSSPETHR